MVRKLGKMVSAAAAVAKGTRKLAAGAATAAKSAETVYKILLTGLMIHEAVFRKRRKSHGSKRTKRVLPHAKNKFLSSR